MTKLEPSVEIIESYKDYEPSIAATTVTRKLIDNIPQKYLFGLGQIVITNHSGLPRRELRKKVRSRKRKVSMEKVRGFYHPRTGGNPAWIEIFIDQIADLKLDFVQKIPVLREKAFSEVLYHEIGHHIHTAIHPDHREREDIAEEWEAKLWWRYYAKKKYWYLLPLLRLLFKLYYSRLYQWFEKKVISDIVEKQKKYEAQSAPKKSS